jgi:hypothetical protein
MEDPNLEETPSSPAQPVEEIPEAPLPNDVLSSFETDTVQTTAETLAEKHKNKHQALQQTFRRLTDETDAVPEEPGAAAEVLEGQELPSLAADLQHAPVEQAPAGEITLLEAFLHQARGFTHRVGQGVRRRSQRLTRRLGQGAHRWSQRFTRQTSPVQEGEVALGQPPDRRFQNAWPRMRPFLWRGRVGPAFWTVASTLSLVVNIILIVILILLGRQLFFLKKTVVNDQLINGLYENFVLMDQAHIQTTITVSDTLQVKDNIPVVFDLPLSQKTTVVLTKDTPVNNATIYLNGQPVPLDLVLREGTELSIKLDLTVPVNQTIPVVLNVPVNLQVPVDIPLNQTQLHKPFVGLQQVVSPFRQLLGRVPDSWSEVCKGPMKTICSMLRFK